MHDLETIKRLNFVNPKQEKVLYPVGTNVHSAEKFKTPLCPYCYDGSIVIKDEELKCTACDKQVIIKQV